jgi:alpha-ketoglutaric semialdehyde dehydrogenase
VIVERPILSEFVDRLTARAQSWRAGDPLDPQTTIGPVASAEQLDTVLGHLAQAHRDGAKALVGGERLQGELSAGYFVPPTVFVDVEAHQPIAREEIFGPVAAVIAADSYAHAIELANDTPYGLSASLFTQDLARAAHFVDDIHAGVIKVNQGTSGVEIHVPFGGTKDSGYGQREQGKAAREFFTESKTAYIGYS